MADLTNSLGFDMFQATLDERTRAIDDARWQRELKAIEKKERAHAPERGHAPARSVETEASCETPLAVTTQLPNV
jgi:hypothetical protein